MVEYIGTNAMPCAELISIGTELLLGEILDTNSQFLALILRDNGIDLFRTTTIGDNAQRIAQAIKDALTRADIIITTGGLGPTIDDPTREAVALALNVTTEYHPELWEQIQNRFNRYARTPTENNRRQAFIPQNSIAIENPVGTAPAFYIEINNQTIISLPGVPQEMEHLSNSFVIPYLRKRYQINSIIKSRVLHTAGIGESQLDSYISDLEYKSNPTVGLAAHSGQVDIRITAKAESPESAAQMIDGVEIDIRERVGKWIYGTDNQTLEDIALQVLSKKGWKLSTIEAGLRGELAGHLAQNKQIYLGGEVLTTPPEPAEFEKIVAAHNQRYSSEVSLGVAIYPQNEKQNVLIIVMTPEGIRKSERPFGGPPQYAVRWAINHSLNIIRDL